MDAGRMVVTWTTQGLVVFWGAFGGAGWALFKGDGMLLVLSLFLVCLVGFARWASARNGAGLGVKRHLPGRVTAGVDFEVGLAITSSAGRRRALQLRDAIAGAQADCLWIDTIPGGGLAAGRLVGRRWRRGRAASADCGVSSRYPLGFFEMRAVVPVVGDLSLLVLPRPTVPPALRSVLEMARWEENRGSSRFLAGAEEFRGTRDYRSGDPVRSIHWPATARLERLVVKEWDPPAPRPGRFGILLHAWGGGKRAVMRPENWERAISLVSGIYFFCKSSQIPLRISTPGLAGIPVKVPESLSGDGLLKHLALLDRRSDQTRDEVLADLRAMSDCDKVFVISDGPAANWDGLVGDSLSSREKGWIICLDGSGSIKRLTPLLRNSRLP